MKTKIRPAAKIVFAALIVGILFAVYFKFAPKKVETTTEQGVIDSISASTPASTPVVVDTASASVVPTNVSPVVASSAKLDTVSNVKTEVAPVQKKQTPKKETSTTVKEKKTKKKEEDRENLNVNFN